jgi:hypothetical protein
MKSAVNRIVRFVVAMFALLGLPVCTTSTPRWAGSN